MNPTPAGRYYAAVNALRKAGVAVALNVPRRPNRVRATDLRMRDNTCPYAFTLGRWRHEIHWRDGTAINWRRRPVDRIYWNHGNGAGPQVVDTFTSYGFTVVWNGREETAIRIELA